MNSTRKYSDRHLISQLQLLARHFGRTPSKGEMREHKLPSETAYRARFGSLRKALELADLKPNAAHYVKGVGIRRKSPGPPVKNTRRKLLNHFERVRREVGRTPTMHDLYTYAPPYPGSYTREFGSLRAAALAAGMTPNKAPGDARWSDEDLLQHLRELAKKLGRRPERRDVLAATGPKYSVYFRRFGSFHRALVFAGFKMRRKA